MYLVRIPWLLKRAFPGLTWNIPGKQPVIYLTFDDGPTPGITPELLSILAKHNARATFFCIGRNVERHPDLFKQIIAAGHATGNHTYSHLKGWYSGNPDYFNDIALAARFIPSILFRPAYGMITLSQLRFLKQQYRVVLWDVMSFDFHPGIGNEKCLTNVIRNAHPGSIVVFHDSLKASENMLYALPRVLDYFGGKGFAFESIPE